MIPVYAAQSLINSSTHYELCVALGFSPCEAVDPTFYLDLKGTQVVLALPSGVLDLDWEREARDLARQRLGTRDDLFARALRPAGGERIERVLDLTCGTGRDTLHLLALGLEVVALERDPYLFLLQFFAARKLAHPKLTISFGEASEYLVAASDFDIIYFDPMYEDSTHAKKRKAAPRREMQLFYEYFQLRRAPLESELEQAQIVSLARAQAKRRVVVKRSLKAPPLGEKAPYSYLGKSTRYDGYPPLKPPA